MTKKILILGVGGFIGGTLVGSILEQKPDWEIYGMDLSHDKVQEFIGHERFHFTQGNIIEQEDWIKEHIEKCDVIFPLVAIANPAVYVSNPLLIFELGFEENLKIIRWCVEHKKHVVFPSTSEVYGMNDDDEFCEETSNFVTGPVNKTRWIYATSKQLLGRIIYAYGEQGLNYTLFRPFNWIGEKLDNIIDKPGGSRVLTQFISNVIHGKDIQLVGGGLQKRCFTDSSEGVDALVRIIDRADSEANRRVFNIGNPENNYSIKELAEMTLEEIKKFPAYAEKANKCKIVDIDSAEYYGSGYQDVKSRVPAIRNAKELLGWEPKITLRESVQKILAYHLKD